VLEPLTDEEAAIADLVDEPDRAQSWSRQARRLEEDRP
jgi:hypothetical protein